MEEELISESRQLSKYNTAFFINERLHYLWTDANEHSRNGMFNKWNLDLDAIWRELARDFKFKKEKSKKTEKEIEETDTEFKNFEKKFNEFDENLSHTGVLSNGDNNSRFEENSLINMQRRNNQYKILNNKELFLKRLENYLGKGTKFQDNEEDMM
jgi:hypothetical protein